MHKLIPSLVHVDDDLVVVNKPPGISTHAPAPHSNPGFYEWLRNRHPDLADLSIVHRLDKGTSGILLFARTTSANQSLVQQFEQRRIQKRYLLLTDQPVADEIPEQRSHIEREGNSYVSRPAGEEKTLAITRFRRVGTHRLGSVVEAIPLTGKTHQIRIHAAAAGFPLLGDTAYGGTPAPRLYLHATSITISHPNNGESQSFESTPEWEKDPALALREGILDPNDTLCRLIHGQDEGWHGFFVDRLGPFLLSHSEGPLTKKQEKRLAALASTLGSTGVYHKMREVHVGRETPDNLNASLVMGEKADGPFPVVENGIRYNADLQAGYSNGIFGDQRENRRRFLTGSIHHDFPLFETEHTPEVLNTFAYTCGFSVCAAKGGAKVTSVDLSRKYLDWGEENFRINDLDPSLHDFIYGDVFNWLKRFRKKERGFDAIILDPPTFSRSKESGVFRATEDYGRLVQAAAHVLRPGGVLLACTNASTITSTLFIQMVHESLATIDRPPTTSFFAPQPGDFPIGRKDPIHLKSLWLRIP